MNPSPRQSGFTLIEFAMVVAISAVLIVGLSTIIEVPRMAMEQRETGARLSSVDRALSILDRDVRFARDVRTPDSRTLEIDEADGGIVVYAWSGTPGDPIVRSDADGMSEIARGVQGLAFSLRTSEKVVAGGVAVGQDEVVSEAAAFEDFQLASGYSWSTGGVVRRLTNAITRSVSTFGISDLRRPGFWFRAGGLGADAGAPSLFRLRARRYGGGDLQVRVYQAVGDGDDDDGDGVDVAEAPTRDALVAMGVVANASLPSSFADVSVPLTSVRKLRDGVPYFVELCSDRADFAAELQVETVSDLAGIAGTNGGLTRSTNSGATFANYSDSLATSQTRFALHVVQSEAVAPTEAVGARRVEIVTAVGLQVTLGATGDAESLEATFPIQNKLAELQ